MSFFAFGFNYESAPVEVRDAFSLDEQRQRLLYREAICSEGAEWILLSTCNRTEVYLFGSEADVTSVQDKLSELAGLVWQEQYAFLYEDEAAVRHVLHVTSGLKSLVLGDAQILSQVKQAYRIAAEEDRVSTVMHRLMHSAFRAAKRVLTETSLTTGASSISGAAVAMARSYYDEITQNGLKGLHAAVIGAGQMGRLALQALSKYDLAKLSVTNRSAERAQQAASASGAMVFDWEDRYQFIRTVDLVIVATGAHHPVLEAEEMQDPLEPNGKVLLIDIGVPRNVDRAIDGLASYRVLDLDALTCWLEQVEESRRGELPSARDICEELLAEFVTWMFHQQALQPGINAIRETFEAIRQQEINRHHHRFSEADRAELEVLTKSIMQKLLAVPIVRLKSIGPESMDFARAIQLLETLFSRPLCEDGEEHTVSDQRTGDADAHPGGLSHPGVCTATTHTGSESHPYVPSDVQP